MWADYEREETHHTSLHTVLSFSVRSGVTPLLIATSKKDAECVKLLLKYNCCMTTKGKVFRKRLNMEFTFDPIEMALDDGSFHLLQVFLAAGYPTSSIRSQVNTHTHRNTHRGPSPPPHTQRHPPPHTHTQANTTLLTPTETYAHPPTSQARPPPPTHTDIGTHTQPPPPPHTHTHRHTYTCTRTQTWVELPLLSYMSVCKMKWMPDWVEFCLCCSETFW